MPFRMPSSAIGKILSAPAKETIYHAEFNQGSKVFIRKRKIKKLSTSGYSYGCFDPYWSRTSKGRFNPEQQKVYIQQENMPYYFLNIIKEFNELFPYTQVEIIITEPRYIYTNNQLGKVVGNYNKLMNTYQVTSEPLEDREYLYNFLKVLWTVKFHEEIPLEYHRYLTYLVHSMIRHFAVGDGTYTYYVYWNDPVEAGKFKDYLNYFISIANGSCSAWRNSYNRFIDGIDFFEPLQNLECIKNYLSKETIEYGRIFKQTSQWNALHSKYSEIIRKNKGE